LPSQREDCLFCGIVRDGTYVAQTKGFVAINDIHPLASVHLLIIPEHHVDSFREVGEFSARESKRMLEFVADTARDAGLVDYKVQVNVGPSAGQTVFHLHWHVLGEAPHESHGEAMATAVSEL
jgi:histidine triad (HIT) family protein